MKKGVTIPASVEFATQWTSASAQLTHTTVVKKLWAESQLETRDHCHGHTMPSPRGVLYLDDSGDSGGSSPSDDLGANR